MSHGINAPFLFGEVQIKDTLIALFIVVRDLCILASITNFPGAKSIWKFLTPQKRVPLFKWAACMKEHYQTYCSYHWNNQSDSQICKFYLGSQEQNLLKCQQKLNWYASSTLTVRHIWMPIIPVHRKPACEGLAGKVSETQAAECLTLGTAEERKSETAWLQIRAEWPLGQLVILLLGHQQAGVSREHSLLLQ